MCSGAQLQIDRQTTTQSGFEGHFLLALSRREKPTFRNSQNKFGHLSK
jgi:hypothetical protein